MCPFLCINDICFQDLRWMKGGGVIAMHTFDVIARGIAEIFVCSLAVFGTEGEKNEWRQTHVSLSTCSIVLWRNTDTLLRQASTSFTRKHIPFQTFFSFSALKHLPSSGIVHCFAQCLRKGIVPTELGRRVLKYLNS